MHVLLSMSPKELSRKRHKVPLPTSCASMDILIPARSTFFYGAILLSCGARVGKVELL